MLGFPIESIIMRKKKTSYLRQTAFTTLFFAASLYMLTSCKYVQDENSSLLCSEIQYSIEHGMVSEADSLLNTLLRSYRMPMSWKKYYHMWIADVAEQYEEYAICYQHLKMGNGRKKETERMIQVEALSNLPEIDCIRQREEFTLDYFIDSLSAVIFLPIEIGGQQELLQFDNGALLSVTYESFAKEHSIYPTGVWTEITDISGTTTAWIGIADSLKLGQLVFYNVKFAVLPDVKDTVRTVSNNTSIGFNILRMCGEMIFDNKAHTIKFPFKQRLVTPNLMHGKPGCQYTEAVIQDDTLKFILDFGSTYSLLSSNYVNNFDIDSSSQTDSIMWNTSSGTRQCCMQVFNDITIEAGGGEHKMSTIYGFVDKIPIIDDGYGMIGVDFLLNFDKAVLNLDKLYFYVDEKE